MISRLNLVMGAGLILVLLLNSGMLLGGLLLAHQWEWLHPATATTVVIILGIGLTAGLNQLAWTIGNKIDPRHDGYV